MNQIWALNQAEVQYISWDDFRCEITHDNYKKILFIVKIDILNDWNNTVFHEKSFCIEKVVILSQMSHKNLKQMYWNWDNNIFCVTFLQNWAPSQNSNTLHSKLHTTFFDPVPFWVNIVILWAQLFVIFFKKGNLLYRDYSLKTGISSQWSLAWSFVRGSNE